MKKKLVRAWAKHERLVNLVALAVAVLYPLIFTSPYVMNIVIMGLIFSVLSISLNLITGYLGQVTLGHAAFYSIGAYVAALLATKFQWSFLATFVCAAALSSLFGVLLGLPTLRLSGNYLAIVTMAFGEIARLIELNWMSVTRGPMGIPAIPAPSLFGVELSTPRSKYYLILIVLILSIIVVHNIVNSRTGRTFLAIKGDSIAAEAMGINLFRYKLLCFSLSAMIAGVAGAFYAHYMSFIDPTSLSAGVSTRILSMTIMGGLGSIPGSIFGALTLTAVPELLRALSEAMLHWSESLAPVARALVESRQIVYGIILVIMVLVKSDGLLGGINLKYERQNMRMEEEAEKEAAEP